LWISGRFWADRKQNEGEVEIEARVGQWDYTMHTSSMLDAAQASLGGASRIPATYINTFEIQI
jgi:hypothetical protein